MPTALKNIQTKNLISIVLLVFVPIAIVAEKLEWDALIVFGLSAVAIIPAILILKKNQIKFSCLNRELVSNHHFLTNNYHPTLEIDSFLKVCP